MRLIDADALDMYEALKSYYGDAWRDAQKEIDNAPAVDAEPVIRCKDCLWHYGTICRRDSTFPWEDDDYCSKAEVEE